MLIFQVGSHSADACMTGELVTTARTVRMRGRRAGYHSSRSADACMRGELITTARTVRMRAWQESWSPQLAQIGCVHDRRAGYHRSHRADAWQESWSPQLGQCGCMTGELVTSGEQIQLTLGVNVRTKYINYTHLLLIYCRYITV